MIPKHGWLPRDLSLKDSWLEKHPDNPLQQDLPTRFEEFTLGFDVATTLGAGYALDAACGFEPGIHIFPYLLSEAGYEVEALDKEPKHMDMPSDPRVTRKLQDIADLSQYADNEFPLVVCISVLEHVQHAKREVIVDELFRVARDAVLITTDDLQPKLLAQWATDRGWQAGEYDDADSAQRTKPPVSYLIAIP